MKRSLGIALLVGAVLCSARSQPYYFNVLSPSPYDLPYALNLFGTDVYVLKRPQESHQSVRLQGFPSGFRGLIADPVSDWFRNPAYDVGTRSFELYGFGTDASTILGGGITTIDRSTVGLFLSAGLASERSSEGTSASSFPPSSVSSGRSNSDDLTNSVDATLLYRLRLEENIALGFGYQFTRGRTERVSNYRSFSSGNTETLFDERKGTVRANTHAATAGVHFRGTTTHLALRARVVRSTPQLSETYEHSRTSPFARSKNLTNDNNNLSTTGILGGFEYAFPINDTWHARTLLEVAHTSYKAPGARVAEVASGDSVYRYFDNSQGNQHVEGNILDVKIGATAARRIGEHLNIFAGVVFNYIKKKSDQSEVATEVHSSPSTPALTSTINTLFGLNGQGVVLQVPIGGEYALSKVLTFRGGVMPQYISVRSEWNRTRTDTLPSTISNGWMVRDKSLRFLTTMGLSLHDEEVGEMHIAYGVNEAGVRSWSLSARYIL